MTETTPAPTPADLTAMEDLLDDLRTRSEEVPQWEFCEGFLAALVCCRRAIDADEFWTCCSTPKASLMRPSVKRFWPYGSAAMARCWL